MKLLTFVKQGQLALGVKTEKGILDVQEAAKGAGVQLPDSIMSVIEQGSAVGELEKLVLSVSDDSPAWLQESDLQFGPCVTEPKKIICVGLNYRKHAEETKAAIPEFPILFNKFHNTITAHGSEIAIPRTTTRLDYEAELVIVIGKQAKYVPREEALNYVFGYCCVNDLSARDLQLRTPQWMLGKIGDGFSPIGPYLVTADEVGNPNELAIKARVNGELRQNSNTADMIFPCDEIVSYISQHLTLVPGDIILTGTPEGVVLGLPKEQRVYLQPGDVVTIEIEKLGSLTNRLVAE
ncbi:MULTISPECIES: fumarylacetoacetate hydrolase family protein [Cohnella]|uniref:2-keto-4-pentenoate hydratase/2-oxohepta-3-ene-1,7-dioic acid hydratase in catechol pathway n=1 Tax=Cohnella phaseoli TaxID=456490 RepID=A0A3D9JRK7_9BACL|nr:fumarylacetoacetate hydrolase family protein [Cohnella phaseoli]RED76743.1 2-keto-4-pentenoate hydratase/2-oxohepta-3-ene-1,7-dioic acid hydratase in catechol pathway [Cohnella phaseoli]